LAIVFAIARSALPRTLRVRRNEAERLGDQLDLARIRRDFAQKVDRGLRPQLDREADHIAAQGQGFVTHGVLQPNKS
jgi:hypothetical protein